MRAAVVALVVALAGCPQPKAGPARPQTPGEVVSAVRGAIEQWRQAYEVHSVDALEKLYAHDPDTVIVQDAGPLVGWSAVDAMLKDRFAHAKEVRVKLKDVEVASRSPEVATAVATMSREISDGTTTVNENGVLTLVLRKDGAEWHIVVEHYSYKRP